MMKIMPCIYISSENDIKVIKVNYCDTDNINNIIIK